MAERRRIGLLVDGQTIKGWQFSIVELLLAGEHFEIVAIIENCMERESFFSKLRYRWSRIPWVMANKIEAWLSLLRFGRRWQHLDPAVDQDVSLARLSISYEHLRITPLVSRSGLIQRFSPGDLERVRALRLDVLLRFGFNILKGDVLKVARFGIWSFHHADGMLYSGGPPGFWEVLKGEDYTGATLQVLTEDLDNGVVIRKGHYPTFLYSWNENRRLTYWRSRFLMVDALKEMAVTGTIPEKYDDCPKVFRLCCHRLFGAPLLPDVLSASTRLLWRLATRPFRNSISGEQWQLLLCRGPLEGRSMRQFEPVIPPKGRYWADPFLVERDGATWMFFEDFCFRRNKGGIACIRIKDKGYDSYSEVLNLPYHMSYPFLFEHERCFYMIPETHENRTVELWRCVNFPNRWEKIRTIFENVSAADTTLLEHDGRWWMFVNLDRSNLQDHGTELFIYYTDDPIWGEWHSHAANPVVVDVRRARMGGGFIRADCGRLIRCGQVGGPKYGVGLRFLEVVKLTTNEFEERLVEEIKPLWRPNAVGIHHCHHLPNLTAFDVCVRISRLR